MVGGEGHSLSDEAQQQEAEHRPRSLGFVRAMRLSGRIAFAEVYEQGWGKSRGPLKMISRPNGLTIGRMGLSVGRRVGTAPRRNRIKRLLRESFRHLDPTARSGYDFVLVVRPHEPLDLTAYQTIMIELVAQARKHWAKQDGEKGK